MPKTNNTKNIHNVPPSITLEPTRQHAVLGVCASPHKCMYNLAARPIFPNASNITINPNGLSVTINGIYHHYGMTLRGVQGMANYDHDGAMISDVDLKKAKITLKYIGWKEASYKGTAAEKEAHRKKSERYRASPDYVRPDGKTTVRGLVANLYAKKIKNENKDLL